MVSESARIFRLRRTEREIAALRAVCSHWQHGADRFWAFDDILRAIEQPSCLVLYAADLADDLTWQGVAIADAGPFTVDLLYIWVQPKVRRMGLARLLLQTLLSELEKQGHLEALFLEVRASNSSAQALYRACGLEPIGRRRAYYADGEDALVFKKFLTTSSAPKAEA